MSRQHAEATAPCRVDLAGGGLDVWPVYLAHPGAAVVSVAVDRRAWCRVEIGGEGVRIESRDAPVKASAPRAAELPEDGPLGLVAHVLRVLQVESAMLVAVREGVPASAGLGSPSALAVAVAAAVNAALGRAVDPDRLWPLLRDAATRSLGYPTGLRGYPPALHGGTLALHLEAGQVRVEPLPVDPARVEESLLFVDSGATSASMIGEWRAVRGQVEGDERVRASLATLAAVARDVRDALVDGRFEDVGNLLAAEWEARKSLLPGVTSPEIDRAVEVARAAGGAAKPCGAAGGSVLAVWAPPGSRGPGRGEAAREALTAAGFRVFPARVDLRGLEVA